MNDKSKEGRESENRMVYLRFYSGISKSIINPNMQWNKGANKFMIACFILCFLFLEVVMEFTGPFVWTRFSHPNTFLKRRSAEGPPSNEMVGGQGCESILATHLLTKWNVSAFRKCCKSSLSCRTMSTNGLRTCQR